MKKLMNYDWDILVKPLPFQNGTLTLWSDEYIAKNVIKRHLDENVDSGSRKVKTIKKTVKWIMEMHPNIKKILDVGCGPGLYAPLFCEYGAEYDGIDISPYQVEFAKESNSLLKRARFYKGDFRTWEINDKYDIVLFLYGIYSFYSRNERIKFLKKARENLTSNGHVIVEVFTNNHYQGRIDTSDWNYIERDGFWSSQPYLELNSFRRYNESLVLIQAGVLNETLNVWNSWIKTFEVSELLLELREAGFVEFACFGSCYGGEFMPDSEVLCVLAK